MSPNPWERPNSPKRPVKSPKTGQAGDRGDRAGQPSQRGGGGDRGGQQRGGGGDDNPGQPSPWLNPANPPQIQNSASFVEYLRWMRSPHPKGSQESKNLDPGTKLELLEKAQTNSSQYNKQHLARCQRRLEMLAKGGVIFQAAAPWRIRVGGHRGPESTLLPAFDALGIPYIPSSTLRGVARAQAIREFMSMGWEKANLHVARWFGHLDASDGDRVGKIVFFDAYPLPGQDGLAIDMANKIWNWEGETPKYSPNPNSFLSLQKPTFLFGMKLASGIDDQQLLEKVKSWLIQGLQSGIGSQVNSGYGELKVKDKKQKLLGFFEVNFEVEGQLIHGCQELTKWNWNEGKNHWEMRGKPQAEVRPIAFKSMLRYWFRVLSLGVLPVDNVKDLEACIFGSINPKTIWGWVRVVVRDGKVTQCEPQPNFKGKNDKCGQQEGKLVIFLTPSCPSDQASNVQVLLKSLTWLMFHLGGIGQGARRPCYSRKTRDRAPWYRGSTLFVEENTFWELPETTEEFQSLFRKHLKNFYAALSDLSKTTINPNQPYAVRIDGSMQWTEAIDRNCHIAVCSGSGRYGKPFALATLHDQAFKVNNNYDGNLCGSVKPVVKPSPVWIANHDDYQVVTVFGSTSDPRQKFLRKLKEDATSYQQLWPL